MRPQSAISISASNMASVATNRLSNERTRPVSKVQLKSLHPRGRLYTKLSMKTFCLGLPGA